MTRSERPAEATDGDRELLQALRAGAPDAFLELVKRYHGALVRTALAYVRERGLAEDVVQESWIAILKGLDRFEGRSSLRTWIFRIVVYQAKSRARRERRTVPISALDDTQLQPSVDPARFRSPGERWAGHWLVGPSSWGPDASARLMTRETFQVIRQALDTLPHLQQVVMSLRDLHGWSSAEVSEALEISRGNQRVLLHRARSRVRGALERYLERS